MAYLFKQKFLLSDIAPMAPADKKLILLAEAEEYLFAVYAGYLEAQNFAVAPCAKPGYLLAEIDKHCPDLLIIGVNLAGSTAALAGLLSEVRNFHGRLPIITIGHGLGFEELKQLMSAGISGHIDRKFTRPRDVVHVVKAILG